MALVRLTNCGFGLAATLAVLSGCATMPENAPSISATARTAINDDAVTAAQFEELSAPELKQPDSLAESGGSTNFIPEPLPPTDVLTLEALEEMAIVSNPSLKQAMARICALRGKWVQAGLPPNPSVGYVASEIGNEGAVGQQGAFVGQKFIRGNKLERSQAVVAAEIALAEQQMAAAEQKVRTDVRKGYYEALLAQRRVELAEELVRLSGEAAEASKSLWKAQEIPLAGLLQAEVQEQNRFVVLRTSQNRLRRAWRSLSARIGPIELPVQPLVGDVDALPASLDWQQQLDRIQSLSPEVSAAMADVDRARRALGRACVEAVPDINTQLSVQYDDSTDDTITGIQVGMPLPIWNRNQGGIRQAKSEVTEAVRNADRVQLALARRLADAYLAYSDARFTAETYAIEILPRAERTFQLVQQGYQQGEVGYLDSLVAQQTFSQTNLTYLDALGSLWQSHVFIEGLLLEDGLSRP
jgi:cobalt-zinc-cadmium efflux system outer membrane protein